MNTTNRFAFVLALALGATAAGCSSADPAHTGDDGGGDDGSGGGTEGSRSLDASGTYTVHSTFDIASNVPGTAGTVVNDIIDATDGKNDPSDWLLTKAVNALPTGTAKDVLTFAKSVAVGYLNQQLLNFAPDFVTTILTVGNDFGDITKKFGLIETIDLTGSAGSYTAKITVTGAHFKIGTVESDYLLANYNVPNIVVDNVAVTMDATGALNIAAHDVPLSFGKLLRVALDGAIIPLIDPNAQNLGDLFADFINCDAVGELVANNFTVPFVSASSVADFVSSGCSAGLTYASGLVYQEIDKIDGNALNFHLTGTAKGMDTNNDRVIDTIVTGSWTGMLSYGNTPTAMTPSAFTGARN